MKPLRANSLLFVGLLAVVLFPGCEKKKPVVPAPQAQAPAPTEESTPISETQQAQAPHPPTQGTPPPDPGQVQAAEEKAETQPESQTPDDNAGKNKAKAARSRSAKKPAPPDTARNTPPKIVVKPDGAEPSATPGLISPSPPGDVSHDQPNTEQLLQSSESNLNNIKRHLSPDEQAIVTQIRDYMSQSRQATKENDLVRARNLALKAHLLSDDLAKRR
jgi:hypothetical protein